MTAIRLGHGAPILTARRHATGAGKPFAYLHQGKQQPAGEAQFEREGEGHPLAGQFAGHHRIDDQTRQGGHGRDQGKGPEADRRQAVGVILNIVWKERHQAGEDQEIAAAVGDTALNRLKDGGPWPTLQQRCSRSRPSQRAIKNDSEEARVAAANESKEPVSGP